MDTAGKCNETPPVSRTFQTFQKQKPNLTWIIIIIDRNETSLQMSHARRVKSTKNAQRFCDKHNIIMMLLVVKVINSSQNNHLVNDVAQIIFIRTEPVVTMRSSQRMIYYTIRKPNNRCQGNALCSVRVKSVCL